MRLGLGTMRCCGAGAWGEPRDLTAVQDTIQVAYRQGIRYFDSAGFYGPDVALRLLRDNLPQDHDAVISTKVGINRQNRSDWTVDASPQAIGQQVERDLQTLGVDCLDLVFLRLGDGQHLPRDPRPLQESVVALRDLQQAGKLRAIGLSQCSLTDLQDAQQVATISAVQNLYNIKHQEDRQFLSYCTAEQLDYWAYYPLGMGGFSKKPSATLQQMTERYQCSVSQLCLAWLLAQSPRMHPIFGTSNVDHLAENLYSEQIQISAVDRARLSQFWDV